MYLYTLSGLRGQNKLSSHQQKKAACEQAAFGTTYAVCYSRSERFQLIRSPSVVLLEEEEEELLWSLSRSL